MTTGTPRVDFHGFCLRCFYDLRGLPEPRCPECGRRFDPADPRTFSATPSPERVQQLLHKTATSLMEGLQFLNPTDAQALRRASVERRLGELARENADLRVFVDLLAGLLVEKGVVRPEEVEDILRRARRSVRRTHASRRGRPPRGGRPRTVPRPAPTPPRPPAERRKGGNSKPRWERVAGARRENVSMAAASAPRGMMGAGWGDRSFELDAGRRGIGEWRWHRTCDTRRPNATRPRRRPRPRRSSSAAFVPGAGEDGRVPGRREPRARACRPRKSASTSAKPTTSSGWTCRTRARPRWPCSWTSSGSTRSRSKAPARGSGGRSWTSTRATSPWSPTPRCRPRVAGRRRVGRAAGRRGGPVHRPQLRRFRSTAAASRRWRRRPPAGRAAARCSARAWGSSSTPCSTR